MQRIEWSDKYSVGLATLDAQHRRLAEIVNDLQIAMEQGKGQEAAGDLLERLDEYARTHLETEERLLEAHNYPAFDAHKIEHTAYLERMQRFREQQRQGKMVMSVPLMHFLRDWWGRHILESDMKYVPYLRR